MNKLKNRSLKYGSMSAAFIVVFIAIIVILNIVANMLVDRFPLKLDLTKNKAYSMSADTIKFLKTYDKDTEITLCTERANLTSSTAGASAVELIEGYRKRNSKIKVSYVNIDKNPAFASNYSSDSLSTDSVIIKSGEKYKVLSLSSLYSSETDYYGNSTGSVTSSAENEITGALAYLAATKQIKLSFITNHNEASTSGLKTLLEKNNYVVGDDTNLINADIASDVEMLVIASPKSDFTDAEINKLTKFLSNGDKLGKNLMVFMDPSEASLPILEKFLKEYWGVKINPGFVYDTKNYYSSQANLVATYAESKISANVQKKNLSTVVPAVRPIEITFKENQSGNVAVTTLLTSSESSYYLSDTKGKADTSKDKAGPFNLMTLSTKTIYEGTDAKTSNVLVCGSLDILNDQIITLPQFGNGDMVLAVANKMSNIESAISIVPKDLSEPKLTVNSSLMSLYLVIFIIFIPLIAVCIGVVVFLRRRHL